ICAFVGTRGAKRQQSIDSRYDDSRSDRPVRDGPGFAFASDEPATGSAAHSRPHRRDESREKKRETGGGGAAAEAEPAAVERLKTEDAGGKTPPFGNQKIATA